MGATGRDIVEQAEARLAPLLEDANIAWWDSQVEATEDNAAKRERAELAWSNALADREQFAAVESARDQGASGDVGRRLDLLYDATLRHQVPDRLRERIVELETSIDLRFSRHRGIVGGREVGDTEIKKILRRSDDPRERREAWEASKTVGAVVADDVREVARLRNEAARSLGHRDWYALSLATDELDELRLADTLAEADRATAEPFGRWKAVLDERLAARFGCAVADLRPWHHADPFFQEASPDGAVDLDPYLEGARHRRPCPQDDRGRRPRGRTASSRGATSTPATARTSTRSASTSTVGATSACSRTSCRPTSPQTRCCTSSGTASTTSASATSCRGSSARRTSSRPRRRRSCSARWPGGATGSSTSSA